MKDWLTSLTDVTLENIEIEARIQVYDLDGTDDDTWKFWKILLDLVHEEQERRK